jgi:lysophospholipase L1-like esterase
VRPLARLPALIATSSLAVLVPIHLGAAEGDAPSGGVSAPASASYYLSIGDSLAAGVQPDSGGRDHPTSQGYVDAVAAHLKKKITGLRTVKLGGSGTSRDAINGPPPTNAYPGSSQLDQAERFLKKHRKHVVLITVDLGDNDVEGCISQNGIDQGCVNRGLGDVSRNLATIASRLRAKAGKKIPIVGISDYDQFWAYWLNGGNGQSVASASANVIKRLNRTIDSAWKEAHMISADAASRFHTFDTTPTQLAGHGSVPRAVERICHLTWACSGPPIGFDDHAKTSGYRQIAKAVIAKLPR